MNKRIIAFIIAAVLLVPTTAFAKDQNETKNKKGNSEITTETNNSKKDVSHQNKKENDTLKNEQEKKDTDDLQNTNQYKQEKKNTSTGKDDAKEQFKLSIKEKHEIMKANTKENIELQKEISSKKQELALIVSDIKSGIKSLSTADLAVLLSKSNEIKAILATLLSSSDINSDVKTSALNITAGNFESALASLDKVIAKQDCRHANLVALNEKLDTLLLIANKAKVILSGSLSTLK